MAQSQLGIQLDQNDIDDLVALLHSFSAKVYQVEWGQMSIVKYWIEAVFFLVWFYCGIQYIDFYREEEKVRSELVTITFLQKSLSELKIETLFADFNNTYHYDQHAQLQLQTEKIIQRLPNNLPLKKDIRDLQKTISSYMQLLTWQ